MNILVYSSIIPFPLSEGGKTSQFTMLKELLKEANIHFAAPINSLIDYKNLSDLQSELPSLNVHALNVDIIDLEPKKLSFRILNRVYWQLGKIVKKKSPPQHPILDNSFFLNPVKRKSEAFTEAFAKLVSAIEADILQVDFIDNADIALLAPANCRKVLIMHDLRFATLEQAGLLHKLKPNYLRYLIDLVKHRELPFLRLYDAVFVFSELDKARLLKEGLDNVQIAPFAVPKPLNSMPPNLGACKKIVFLGPEHHVPNKDALKWFVEKCYPLLYPDFNLHVEVVGEWSLSAKKEFSEYSQIHFKGFVPNISVVLKDAILIVPLRMGSGIRTKILDAFYLGSPVVTTSIGVEGILVKHGVECLVADNEKDFVLELRKLSEQIELVNSIRNLAFDFVNQHFDPVKVAKIRIDSYRTMLENNN